MPNEVKSSSHIVGVCYIFHKNITFDTKKSVGVDGHGETAKIFHEDCKKTKNTKDIVRKMLINKVIT